MQDWFKQFIHVGDEVIFTPPDSPTVDSQIGRIESVMYRWLDYPQLQISDAKGKLHTLYPSEVVKLTPFMKRAQQAGAQQSKQRDYFIAGVKFIWRRARLAKQRRKR